MATLYRDMLERLATVPGVRGVALSAPALLSGSVNGTSIYVQGRTYDLSVRDAEQRHQPPGRLAELLRADGDSGAPRARLHRSRQRDAARRSWSSTRPPCASTFPTRIRSAGASARASETSGELEVVGVLRDVKYDSVRDAAPPTMYVPYQQTRVGSPVFEVRTAGLPTSAAGAVREAVRQIDPNLPLMDVSTQIEQVELRFMQEKLFAQAYTLFGGLALLLAAIGLFGLMSYNVSRRTNEIGIRMALGAQRQDVLRLVMRESMILVAIGVAAGLAIALGAGHLVTTLLYGLPPTDADLDRAGHRRDGPRVGCRRLHPGAPGVESRPHGRAALRVEGRNCIDRRSTRPLTTRWPRLTSKRQSLDTAGSALTGRHPPAARENSHLFGLSRVRAHLLSAWFQRVTGDA